MTVWLTLFSSLCVVQISLWIQSLLMNRREQRDRACKKKTLSDSGIDRSSDGPVSVLPSKVRFKKHFSGENKSVLSNQLSSVMDGRSEYGGNNGVARDIDSPEDTVLRGEVPSGPNTNPSSNSDSISPGDVISMMHSFSEFMRTFGPSGRPSGDSSNAELNRQITALAPHKEGTDIVKYIMKLEADLVDIGCPRARFKIILLQKLQSKEATHLVASIDRDEFTYSELKELLIDGLGSSKISLGIKLISEFDSHTKSMNSLESYMYLKGLIDSVSMATHDKGEVLLFLATAIYRALRPAHQRTLLDAREIRFK